MKFIVWGHAGWIGGQVMAAIAAAGHEGIGATSRADDEDAVAAELTSVRPDRAISLIGRTRGPGFTTIDYLEQKGKLQENIRDNLYGPLVLGQLCARRGIHLAYLGTGCIFHYDETHPVPVATADGSSATCGGGFTECDKPNFTGSSYSTVKGFTDRLFHVMFNDTALNCRIRMPITPDDSPYNFITKIANYDRVVNIPNSMTVLPALLPSLIDLSVRGITGTINLTHPGAVSHNDILEMYKRIVDPGYTWENFTVEEQDKILLGARSNNLLDTTRLVELCPDVEPLDKAVEKVMKEIAAKYPRGIVKRRFAAIEAAAPSAS